MRAVDGRPASLRRLAPLSGVVFVALLAVSALLVPPLPDPDATPATVRAFFAEHHAGVLASNVLGGFATVFFLLFAASIVITLRRVPRCPSGVPIAAVTGAVALVPLVLGIGAIEMALAWRPAALDQGAVQAVFAIDSFTFNVSMFPLVLFFGAVAIGLVRAGGAARLLGISAALVAVLHAVAGASVAASGPMAPHGSVYFAAFLAFLAWSIVAAPVLAVRG